VFDVIGEVDKKLAKHWQIVAINLGHNSHDEFAKIIYAGLRSCIFSL